MNFFPGDVDEQKVRYEHHVKRINRLVKIVEGFLQEYSGKIVEKSEENSADCSIEASPDFLEKIKEKVKLNLSVHLNFENHKRQKLNKSEMKSLRIEQVEAKRKSQILSKQQKESLKQEQFQKRISSILMIQKEKNKKWDEKLSRNSSKTFSLTPRTREKKKFDHDSSKLDENEFFIEDQRKHSAKEDKSIDLKSDFIRNRSEKSAVHNGLVDRTLRNYVSTCENERSMKLKSAIMKSDKLEKYKSKKEKSMENYVNKVGFRFMKQMDRVKINLEEEEKKMLGKLDRILNKFQNQKSILSNHESMLRHEHNIKSLKNMLKTQETLENLELIKKEKNLKKAEIVEKHFRNMQKLNMLKDLKEKQNLKTRIEASIQNQELVRQKLLQLKIQNSDDPSRYSKLIESYK